jgi:hypothetical protein
MRPVMLLHPPPHACPKRTVLDSRRPPLPFTHLQAIRRVGSNNPVILLDEIDKMGERR